MVALVIASNCFCHGLNTSKFLTRTHSVSLSAAKSDFVAFLQLRKLPVSLPSHLLRAGGDRARVAGKWLQKGDFMCDGVVVCDFLYVACCSHEKSLVAF
jgi:hypothetical protein